MDFSYPREVLEELNARVKQLIILDHHKTAKEALSGLPYATFDMNKSGAVLAWEYFHPGTPVPKLLQHVQDRDLWRFNLEDTKALMAGMAPRQKIFGDWDRGCGEDYLGRVFLDKIKSEGNAILQYQEEQVKSSVSQTKVVKWLDWKIGIVNTTTLVSEVGHGIYTSENLKVDFSVSYFINTIDNQVILSFRSRGDMDVEAIAKQLGGGGHKNASGARVNMAYLEKMITGKLARGTWNLRWEIFKSKVLDVIKRIRHT